jgi:hypothetical protein
LKKRIIDCLIAQGIDANDKTVRLWKFSGDKEEFVNACAKVSEQKNNEEMKSENGGEESETEYNSGVPFPGDSLEPLLGAATNLEDDSLEDSVLVVEVVTNNTPFAFSFKKN